MVDAVFCESGKRGLPGGGRREVDRRVPAGRNQSAAGTHHHAGRGRIAPPPGGWQHAPTGNRGALRLSWDPIGAARNSSEQ